MSAAPDQLTPYTNATVVFYNKLLFNLIKSILILLQ